MIIFTSYYCFFVNEERFVNHLYNIVSTKEIVSIPKIQDNLIGIFMQNNNIKTRASCNVDNYLILLMIIITEYYCFCVNEERFVRHLYNLQP